MKPIAISLLVWCCAAPRAFAGDDRASAREHFLKGTKAFDLGLFDDAIRDYTEAYKLRDDPALLYNIAQSHRLAGHKAESLHFYKIYLSKIPHAPNRDEVIAKIDELSKAIDQEKRAQTMPPNQPIAPEAHAPPPEEKLPPLIGPPAAAPAPAIAAEPPRPAANARALPIAGLAVGGGGLALPIGGGAPPGLGQNAPPAPSAGGPPPPPPNPALSSTLPTPPA